LGTVALNYLYLQEIHPRLQLHVKKIKQQIFIVDIKIHNFFIRGWQHVQSWLMGCSVDLGVRGSNLDMVNNFT
jgi:hypothetical protein